MSEKSAIEWTDATWTPIRARVKQDAAEIAKARGWTSLVQIGEKMAGRVGPHCEHVSPGCEHCYSETNNSRCLPYNGTGLPFDRRARELVDVFVDERILEQPFHWKQPRNIFVCSQTDLFGEWMPDEFIDRVFAVMALCPQHTFQVLTKRAQRLLTYIRKERMLQWGFRAAELIHSRDGGEASRAAEIARFNEPDFPFPNVWLGVSVENQKYADERIPLLLQTPAAVRWISAEPLLGPIDLTAIRNPYQDNAPVLNWVVAGGESGAEARPMHPEWVRLLRDQCARAGVPFLFKQWGEYADLSNEQDGSALLKKSTVDHIFTPDGEVCGFGYREGRESKGMLDGDWKERGAAWMGRVGKKTAGRMLDGVLHDAYPEARR